jgi:uncharacterized membrane protein HdeD (DUF308 family)
MEIKPTLGNAIHSISGKWGWFIALGVVGLILGSIGSANLMLANLASALFIGAGVLVSGLFHVFHAFSVHGLRGFLFWLIAGVFRAWAGFHSRPAAGWGWIVAAGVLTFVFGVVLIAAWPAVGLWFLGAMLVVDLIFQGWGFIGFGVALKARDSRHSAELQQAHPNP